MEEKELAQRLSDVFIMQPSRIVKGWSNNGLMKKKVTCDTATK